MNDTERFLYELEQENKKWDRMNNIVGVLMILAVGVLLFVALVVGTSRLPDEPIRPAGIQEDDPRWDCHLDGNKICGPGHE